MTIFLSPLLLIDFYFFFKGSRVIYNAVLVSGVQQSDPVTHTHTHTHTHIYTFSDLSYYRLLLHPTIIIPIIGYMLLNIVPCLSPFFNVCMYLFIILLKYSGLTMLY